VTQPPTPPPPPDDDAWPASEDATVVASRETVVTDPVAPPPEGPPPDRRIGAGMLLALGALALVAAGLLIAWLLTHRGDDSSSTTTAAATQPVSTGVAKVAVPRLVGLTEQDALVRLGEVGLRPKEVFKPTSKPNRLVVSQRPLEAKQVPKGSRVTLVIDQGAPTVAVPDLSGQSYADAQAKLDAAGLDATRTEVTSTETPGTVVDQAPKAGAKAEKGSTVTLSVARADTSQTTTSATTTSATTTAPTTTARTTTTSATTTTAAPNQPSSATMPDVQGQTEQAAVTALGQAGILASLVFVPGDDPLGTVLQQAKAGGTTVPFHAHVQINVSKGPNAETDVSVPNAVGQTLSQAVSTMNAANLRLIYAKFPVTSRAQAGKIVQQSPLGGGKAPENAQIVVYLGALQTQ
jgi:beta-lactam-binding protein with PASTA domain